MRQTRIGTRERESIAVTLILLLAGFFRLFQIDRVPPGMHFDEAFNIFDILRLLQGQFSIFFPANHGREPLYFYMTTVAATFFGDQAMTLRLTSAVIGIVTVFVVYGFTRSLFSHSSLQAWDHRPRSGAERGGPGEGARLIAAFAAFLLAISVWHIYYSRLGLRVILSVPLTLLTFWFFWHGLAASPFRGRVGVGVKAFALSGLCAALTVYAYTSGRLLPLILIVLTLSAMILDRSRWRAYLRGLIITGTVALIVFLPLGYYFLTHPADFLEHGSYLSVWDVRVNKGDLGGTLLDNTGAVAGMFLIRGDQEAFRNVPEHPVFDPLIGVLFLIGLGFLLIALVSRKSSVEGRLRSILIATCLIAFLSLAVLSDAPPNFTRTLAAAPFAVLLPAWALSTIWNRMTTLRLQRVAVVGISGVLFVSTALAYNDYFINFASSPALYYAFDVRMVDVAQWVNKTGATNQIYLAPLWYQEGTVSLLTRNSTLKSFESRDTIVLPSRTAGKDALYAFPIEQENKAAKLAERLGNLATREDVYGSTGEKILVVYRVHVIDLPDATNPLPSLSQASAFAQPQKIDRAIWEDQLQLLGYSIGAVDAPKRNLEATLVFQALKPMRDDYTFSIKVRDDKDRVWGQEDKWLGDNSYATTVMSAGDLIAEKFYPGLSPCAPAGDYRITIEMYNPKTGQVASIVDGQPLVALGVAHAELSQGNLYENLDPEQTLDVDVAPQMHLFGYTLTPNELHAGDEFSLSLFLRGQGNAATTRQTAVRLGDTVLAQKEIVLPPEGRGLCAFFDLSVPASVTLGTRALFVNDFKIGTLSVK